MAGNGGYAQMTDEPEYTSAGWTTAQAEAQMKKWGKNEIPEEKEPVSAACSDVSMFGPRLSPPRKPAPSRRVARPRSPR